GDVVEPWHAIVGEGSVRDHSLTEANRLEQRTAQGHDGSAFDLVDHGVRIDDGATLIGGDESNDPKVPLEVGHLCVGRDAPALLDAARDALTHAGAAAHPAESLRRRAQHRDEALVVEIVRTELDRVPAEFAS